MASEIENGDIVREAAIWAANLFAERTRELGETGKIDLYSALPAYRVSWHEVVHQFPGMKGPDQRVAFQEYFNSEIKKRLLWRVLHNRMSAEEWVKKHPRVKEGV
jgi:hypothetical protein